MTRGKDAATLAVAAAVAGGVLGFGQQWIAHQLGVLDPGRDYCCGFGGVELYQAALVVWFAATSVLLGAAVALLASPRFGTDVPADPVPPLPLAALVGGAVAGAALTAPYLLGLAATATYPGDVSWGYAVVAGLLLGVLATALLVRRAASRDAALVWLGAVWLFPVPALLTELVASEFVSEFDLLSVVGGTPAFGPPVGAILAVYAWLYLAPVLVAVALAWWTARRTGRVQVLAATAGAWLAAACFLVVGPGTGEHYYSVHDFRAWVVVTMLALAAAVLWRTPAPDAGARRLATGGAMLLLATFLMPIEENGTFTVFSVSGGDPLAVVTTAAVGGLLLVAGLAAVRSAPPWYAFGGALLAGAVWYALVYGLSGSRGRWSQLWPDNGDVVPDVSPLVWLVPYAILLLAGLAAVGRPRWLALVGAGTSLLTVLYVGQFWTTYHQAVDGVAVLVTVVVFAVAASRTGAASDRVSVSTTSE